MAQVYGGDEIGAIVLDCGSAWTRVGWAGDDSPHETLCTSYTIHKESGERRFGEEQLMLPREHWGVANPLSDSIVADWDAAEALWTRALRGCADQLRDAPLLVTEHLWNTAENRSKTLEIALEKFGSPAAYIAKTAVCSLFAAGRGSGVVVDLGAQTTAITPVIDGLALYKPSRRSRRAGDFLDRCMQELLGDPVVPRCLIKSRVPVTVGEAAQYELRPDLGVLEQSFVDFHRQRVLEDFKQHMVQIWETAPKTSSTGPTESVTPRPEAAEREYEFPDGHTVRYGAERLELGERLFTDGDPGGDSKDGDGSSDTSVSASASASGAVAADAVATTANNDDPGSPMDVDEAETEEKADKPDQRDMKSQPIETLKMPAVPAFSSKGLSALLAESINACDVDARPNLLSNIVVVGGTSLVQGFNDRVQQDLLKEFPASKIRIFSPGNVVERCASAWLGGSILASLGTFQQLWVSKQEYSEIGANQLVQRRFK